MNDPTRVRVSGPLGPYAPGFRAELEARGYAPGSVALQLQLAAELSRWLNCQGLDVNDLTSARIGAFFEMRRARVRVLYLSSRALRVLVEHLDVVGVLPAPEPVEPTPVESFLERYEGYLLQERGPGERTVARYVYVARRFLRSFSGPNHSLDFEDVTAAAATKFLTVECFR